VTVQSLDSVLQEGILVDRKWLKDKGFTRTTVDYYLRSDKIKAVTHGIYRKPGPPLKWQNVVYSLIHLGFHVHVGHKTALGFHGFQHYLALGGDEKICLYCDKNLPKWLNKVGIKQTFVDIPRDPFNGSDAGIEQVPFGTWDWPIPYSSTERAFIELVSTVTTAEEIQSAGLMMEGAANLRPEIVQSLLEGCHQVKAKRLFLWLAREKNHAWYNSIDNSRLDLGTGKRQIIKGGRLDEEYQITVPRKDVIGQVEPIF
jgi:hypothetical protein